MPPWLARSALKRRKTEGFLSGEKGLQGGRQPRLTLNIVISFACRGFAGLKAHDLGPAGGREKTFALAKPKETLVTGGRRSIMRKVRKNRVASPFLWTAKQQCDTSKCLQGGKKPEKTSSA